MYRILASAVGNSIHVVTAFDGYNGHDFSSFPSVVGELYTTRYVRVQGVV